MGGHDVRGDGCTQRTGRVPLRRAACKVKRGIANLHQRASKNRCDLDEHSANDDDDGEGDDDDRKVSVDRNMPQKHTLK